jgi:hypothetical protein
MNATVVDTFDEALRLAGFALAHAAWSVEPGETLCTMAFVEKQGDGGQTLRRYEASTIPESVAMAYEQLAEDLDDGSFAILIFDGYVTPEGQARTDALLGEILGPRGVRLGRFVQAYRAARRPRLPFLGRSSAFEILGDPIVEDPLDEKTSLALIHEGIASHPEGTRLFRVR